VLGLGSSRAKPARTLSFGMSAFFVELIIQPAQGDGEARRIIVNLPDRPEPGEIIELPDGHKVTVDEVSPSRRGDLAAEVRATRYS